MAGYSEDRRDAPPKYDGRLAGPDPPTPDCRLPTMDFRLPTDGLPTSERAAYLREGCVGHRTQERSPGRVQS